MRSFVSILLIIPCISLYAQKPLSQVWIADNGNGSFKNPVINADYSDPDAIRVGDDYYMISSSFNHVPGLPILHSRDLVNWALIAHALPRLIPETWYDTVRHGGGVWAPSIRHHNNEFYIFYPDPDFGIYLTKAKNIKGPWSKPVLVIAGKGLIDPCPLWDGAKQSERLFLTHAYAGSRAGIKSIIVVRELSADGLSQVSPPVLVYDGHEDDPTIEGPKFYKRNNYYYIFAPAGGVKTGWQVVLRSKNVYGPYERRIVMDQGKTTINGPHQGAWIETKAGEDWFLHFQDKEAYGRVVHLQPMKWVNDWPVIGEDADADGKGQPVTVFKKPSHAVRSPITTITDSDEFNSVAPGLQWQWQANPASNWSLATNNGTLRMYSVLDSNSNGSLWNAPYLLGQKLPAEAFTATLKLDFYALHNGEQFGLTVFGSDYAFISLKRKEDRLYIVGAENIAADQGGKEKQIFEQPANGRSFYLRVSLKSGALCDFSFSEDGVTYRAVQHVFTAKPGRWVGAKLGLFCRRKNATNDAGYADIDWFRITSENPVRD